MQDHAQYVRQSSGTGRAPMEPRPPWTTEATIRAKCVSCDACILACPTDILVHGRAKTPVVDFQKGECTFCRACADVCPETLFLPAEAAPWALIAEVSQGCLLTAGISCQLCTDACEVEALRLDLSHRPVGRIEVAEDACTGCGACVAMCPEAAITVGKHRVAHE